MSLSKNKVNAALQARGGFSIVPNELWRMDIPSTAKIIWAYLLSQHPDWACSRNNIARNLKLGRKGVTDMLKLLSDREMIAVKVGRKGTWHIEMMPPDRWKADEVALAEVEDDAGECVLEDTDSMKTGSNRDRFYVEPVPVDPTSNTRIEEKEKIFEKKTVSLSERPIDLPVPKVKPPQPPAIEDIYRKWLSEVPERPDFKACYEELLVLFESMKVAGHKSDDISPSFKKKVLKRWERSKYPDKHQAWLDKAIGSTFCDEVKLSIPELKPEGGVKTKRNDGQITIETALKMLTDDDEIAKMMREYETLRNTPREEISTDD